MRTKISRQPGAQGHARHRRVFPVVGALAALLLSSCAQISAQMDGARVDGEASRSPVSQQLVSTVAWGQLGGMVSVLVRNDSGRVLSRADAVITLLNESGTAVGSSATTTIGGDCCTALNVPPGESFGFYVWAGRDNAVTDVQVEYRNVVWGQSASRGGPQAPVEPLNLFENEAGTVASAIVRPRGGPIESAVMQAVINGPDGEFLAVISGTWYCFLPQEPRKIWMQLYQRVPEGSEIASVTAFPKPDDMSGGDANAQDRCSRQAPDQGAPAPEQDQTTSPEPS